MAEMQCAVCGAESRARYSFRFGRSTGVTDFQQTPFSSGSSYGTRTTYTAHYQIGGQEFVHLCDGCVRKARAVKALKSVVKDFLGFPLFAFFYVLVVISIGSLIFDSQFARATLWFAGAVGVLAAVFVIAWLAFRPANVGVERAMDLRREGLAEQGWRELWTEKEYLKLRPETRSY